MAPNETHLQLNGSRGSLAIRLHEHKAGIFLSGDELLQGDQDWTWTEPLVTDRPDFTESASVPGHGRVQVEGGWTVEESGETREHSLGEILVRIGLGERFEARIEPGSWISADAGDADVSGLDDAGLGFKVLLFEEIPPSFPAVALLLSSSVPTGDDEIGSQEWQPEARLALG